MSAAVEIWNRAEGRLETEQVYGDLGLRLLYGNPIGFSLTGLLLANRSVSRLMGAAQSSARSRRRIQPFIERFRIPMEDFEDRDYESFQDFFIRRFRHGARSFSADPARLPAPCEARYLAFERVDLETTFPVKGRWLSPRLLLKDEALGAVFEGGPLLIARLAPVDYHRFHFPDDGEPVSERRIPGRLHSVNPLALARRGAILATNERHLSILATRSFGTLASIEVGALGVGRIVQTLPQGKPFRRGDEKGYFCFGASTVLLLGEPGRWRPSEDLLEQTAARRETLVRLGDEVARATT